MHVPTYYSPIASIEQTAMNENVSEEDILEALAQGEDVKEPTEGTVYIPGVSRMIYESLDTDGIQTIINMQVKNAKKSE